MIRASLENVELTLTGIETFTTQTRGYAWQGVVEGLKIAYAASAKMIGYADEHTIARLAAMGHPYAKAHPNPPHDLPAIHRQSNVGGYFNALVLIKPIGKGSDIVSGTVQIDPTNTAMVQLDVWLQDGTTMMIARPWMEDVVREFGEMMIDTLDRAILVGMRVDFDKAFA